MRVQNTPGWESSWEIIENPYCNDINSITQSLSVSETYSFRLKFIRACSVLKKEGLYIIVHTTVFCRDKIHISRSSILVHICIMYDKARKLDSMV